MKTIPFLLLFTILPLSCSPQKNLDETLEQLNKKTVDYIYAEDLSETDSLLLLDTRKFEEYKVSHIKNAYWVGYKTFAIDSVLARHPKKDAPIIVYCSIGVRSEDIGEKLLAAGYTNVKNLYGGIFEWKNQGNTVVNQKGQATEKVHAYSKFWGRLLTNGEKVY